MHVAAYLLRWMTAGQANGALPLNNFNKIAPCGIKERCFSDDTSNLRWDCKRSACPRVSHLTLGGCDGESFSLVKQLARQLVHRRQPDRKATSTASAPPPLHNSSLKRSSRACCWPRTLSASRRATRSTRSRAPRGGCLGPRHRRDAHERSDFRSRKIRQCGSTRWRE